MMTNEDWLSYTLPKLGSVLECGVTLCVKKCHIFVLEKLLHALSV